MDLTISDAQDHEWIDCDGHVGGCVYCVRCGYTFSLWRQDVQEAIQKHRENVKQTPRLYQTFGPHGGLAKGGLWTCYPPFSTGILSHSMRIRRNQLAREQYSDEPPF